MFTFHRLTVIFFLILVSLNLWLIIMGKTTASVIHNHAALLYGLLFFIFCAISFVLAFLPCSNFHHPAICHGEKDEKSVSITFDDGPHPVKTPIILEILDKFDVKATFFCIGRNLSGNEDLLKRINDEGHLIGNHSYSHSRWFDLFTAGKIRLELLETDRLVKEISGKSPLFFRPPFGVINPMVSKALKNMHWKVICWNIRSLDTLNIDPEKTRQKILRMLKPGAIILLHDHTQFTEHHLGGLLAAIKEAGYGITPLDKLLKLPAYAN